jgi:hypothetical protein
MPLIKGKAPKPAESPFSPTSLAVAYDAQRRVRSRKAPTSGVAAIPMTMEERPSSIAEAILRKRKAALAPVEEEVGEELDADDSLELDGLDEEPSEPEMPSDPIDRIRARMAARSQD